MNGSGIPVEGIEAVTTAMFIAACRVINEVTPAARSDENRSGASTAIR
jgi:hypothetical protein